MLRPPRWDLTIPLPGAWARAPSLASGKGGGVCGTSRFWSSGLKFLFILYCTCTERSSERGEMRDLRHGRKKSELIIPPLPPPASHSWDPPAVGNGHAEVEG